MSRTSQVLRRNPRPGRHAVGEQQLQRLIIAGHNSDCECRTCRRIRKRKAAQQ